MTSEEVDEAVASFEKELRKDSERVRHAHCTIIYDPPSNGSVKATITRVAKANPLTEAEIIKFRL